MFGSALVRPVIPGIGATSPGSASFPSSRRNACIGPSIEPFAPAPAPLSSFFLSSFGGTSDGSATASTPCSGAPFSSPIRSASLGESSSPHTFTMSRLLPVCSVTFAANRSMSRSRYPASSITFSPFHHTRNAPEAPAQIDTVRGAFVPLFA